MYCNMPASQKRQIIQARVTQEVKDKLAALATLEKRSATNMLEVLIERAFEEANRTNRADNPESGPRRPV
jgi:uncharacterized protein (DUF1778 family)